MTVQRICTNSCWCTQTLHCVVIFYLNKFSFKPNMFNEQTQNKIKQKEKQKVLLLLLLLFGGGAPREERERERQPRDSRVNGHKL